MPRSRNRFRLRDALLCAALALPAAPALAQNAAPAASAAPAPRILGSVTAISADSVTVHQEGPDGADTVVAITPQTRLLKTVPGAKSLKDATPIQLTDLAVGDRVLVRPGPGGDPTHPSAAILVAMKQGDISQAHEQQTADWQRNGVAGIVQAADPASGTITLRPQPGAAPTTIQTSAATDIRRYAPDSTAFADTRKSALADIHPGDQLRARGTKDASNSSVDASEVVAGSFQNIAGTVLSADAATATLTLNDLATKKPVTLHLEATAQLRKLPPEAAERIAGREARHEAGAAAAAPAAEAAQPRSHTGDMAGLLQHAPTITLADLKKGDAVMVVASGPGATQRVALTVVAGVEPLLQASPSASAGLFSASWNLGGGGADASGGEGGPQR